MRVPVLLCLGLLSSQLIGCVSDLRPTALEARSAPRYEACGRAHIARGEQAHTRTGSPPWRDLPGVEVEFDDTYFGLIGTLACPWPEDPCRVRLGFLPASEVATASFSQAGAAQRWGIHGWNTWRQAGSAAPVYTADDERLSFWLPTLEYFLEMPFRLREGELVDCAGDTTITVEGREVPVHRVYVTWGSYAPHPRFDQYLAYFEASSGLLLRVDFTVRDLAPFAKGTVVYSDYQPRDGYWLPGRVLIGSDPPRDLLHELKVIRWRPGAIVPALVPDPARPAGRKPS